MADTLTTYRDRIRYMHLKDVDAGGTWPCSARASATPRSDRDRQRRAQLQRLAGAGGGSETAAADPAGAVKTTARPCGYGPER
jgi:hypothetical protein